MSGNAFRGISAEQDVRFANKEKLTGKSFPACYKTTVNLNKVNFEAMNNWIANRLTELLDGVEDDILIAYVCSQLEGKKTVDPRRLQINLTGFLEANTPKFVKELWELLISASRNPSGIPQKFLDEKAAELRAKEEERIQTQERLRAERERQERLQREERDRVEHEERSTRGRGRSRSRSRSRSKERCHHGYRTRDGDDDDDRKEGRRRWRRRSRSRSSGSRGGGDEDRRRHQPHREREQRRSPSYDAYDKRGRRRTPTPLRRARRDRSCSYSSRSRSRVRRGDRRQHRYSD